MPKLLPTTVSAFDAIAPSSNPLDIGIAGTGISGSFASGSFLVAFPIFQASQCSALWTSNGGGIIGL